MSKRNGPSIHLQKRRWRRRLRSEFEKKVRNKDEPNYKKILEKSIGGKITIERLINHFMPPNLRYILSCYECDCHLAKLKLKSPVKSAVYRVPSCFSLIEAPSASFSFIAKVVAATLLQQSERVVLDYSGCEQLDLSAQVYLDVLLKDVIEFLKRTNHLRSKSVLSIDGKGLNKPNLQKLMWSVGSPALFSTRKFHFPEVVKFTLNIHDRESLQDHDRRIEQKDLDTTALVNYVVECLSRMGKTLTPSALDDLSVVIGEALINAEEHSSTKYRFSIGYFEEERNEKEGFGIFRLAIFNFGETIYDKFKNPDCQARDVVSRMEALSSSYKRQNFFKKKQFEEEALWTLYALQEGVSSVPPKNNVKRGNGSIQFIERFFNLKGEGLHQDDVSRLSILSGNTRIIFDGRYKPKDVVIDNEHFRVMSFNAEGSLEYPPEAACVSFVPNFFPGTMITARILLKKDDVRNE